MSQILVCFCHSYRSWHSFGPHSLTTRKLDCWDKETDLKYPQWCTLVKDGCATQIKHLDCSSIVITKKSPKALTFWRLNSLHCIDRTSLESTISPGGHHAILADALLPSHIRVNEQGTYTAPSPSVFNGIQHWNFVIFPNNGNQYLHKM